MLGAFGGKVTGVELGMLLSFLASRVLGQYETFAPAGLDLPGSAAGGGRLLLVAPNIVHVERELEVDPHDFRLWVCLHEETHRTQFTAVPWLRAHLEGEIQTFLGATEMDPMTVLERLREAAQSFSGARPDAERGEEGRSLVELVQTPNSEKYWAAHRRHVPAGRPRRLRHGRGRPRGGALGRRDPGEVPAAPGQRGGRLDATLRKLLGLDAKLRQYRDGERFVRAVVGQVGMDGFNRVWTSPNTLPTKAEIAKPADWVARVHGKGSEDGGSE